MYLQSILGVGAQRTVGRKSRRAEGVATSLEQTAPDLSRAVGVNAHGCTRVQTVGFVNSRIDATSSERLKSGAESLLPWHTLGAPRFSPYRPCFGSAGAFTTRLFSCIKGVNRPH